MRDEESMVYERNTDDELSMFARPSNLDDENLAIDSRNWSICHLSQGAILDIEQSLLVASSNVCLTVSLTKAEKRDSHGFT